MRLVRAVTKEDGKDYFPVLLQQNDCGVFFIKLADRLHNLRTLSGCSDKKKKKQILETREKFPAVIKELKRRLDVETESNWQIDYLEKQIFGLCDQIEKELQAQGV